MARVEVVTDTRFGVTMPDPYRWMEEDTPERRAWLDGQGRYAEEYLRALPRRQELAERLGELLADTTTLSGFAAGGDQVFCLRHGGDVPVLVVLGRDGERLLLDPATLPGEEHNNLDWFVPSPDGRYVACGIAQGGSEQAVARVLDVRTGELLPDAAPGAHSGVVSWLPDNSGFAYHRYPKPAPDTPAAHKRDHSATYLHVVGTDAAEDVPVLAGGLNPAVEITAQDRPYVLLPAGTDWMIALVSHSAMGNSKTEGITDCTLYVAPRKELADPAGCAWQRLADRSDNVIAWAVHEDTAYLVTYRRAKRCEVLAVSLADPDLDRATVVVPESERAVQAVKVVGDHLLIRDMDGGVDRFRRLPLAGGEPQDVPLPVEGALEEWTGHPDGRSVVLVLSSWTRSPAAYRYDPATGDLADTGWVPPSPVDFGDVVVTDVRVPARDGVEVPLVVLHRKGLAKDGANRTLLSGYGSYGMVLPRRFRPELLAWLERGGVYAFAGLRGGGEFGPQWHLDGKLEHKHRTITDFVDCAEYLVASGYTRPSLLAGEGTSAGGIPSGGSLVRRPDLFGVMVMQVAVSNCTRKEFSENGPINAPEFGTVTTEEGLRALLIVDSYLRVEDGVDYPAVLLTTGLNDPRVAVWQPGKMAARLQAATGSGKPVLLRVEPHAGHGRGTTVAQRAALYADMYAFLLAQLG